MTKVRIIYDNLWRRGTVLAESSQHPQFPSEDTQIDTPLQPWRSRYGTGSGFGLFVIGATNKYIDFDEGGAELTATLATGNYNGTTLATEIKTKMDAAGGTYTITYSETTGKFTIYRAGGNFTLRWQSGTNTANTVGTTLGFVVSSNDTGADTYTSDYRRIHYPAEYIDLDQGSANQFNFVALINHNISASATITVYGADDSAFTSNVVSDVVTHNAANIYFFLSAARTKRYIRVHIADPTNTNSYLQIGTVFIGSYWEPGFSFLVDYEDGFEDASDIEASDDLVIYAREKTILGTMALPFRLTDSDKATAALFMRTVGLTKSFVVCWDYSAPNANSLLCANAELAAPVYKAVNNWDWSMTVREIA
jgi:hypothetical protein